MLPIIASLSQLILLVALLIGALKYKQLPNNLRYLIVLLTWEIITELAGVTLKYQHRPNLFIFPIFCAGEFWLLAAIYDKTLESPTFSRLRPWLAGGFVAYCALDGWLAPEVARFKPALQVLENVMLLSLAGLFFRKLLNELRIIHLTREPMFWVSTGLLIKNLGSLQIYLFSNFLLSHYYQRLNYTIWDVHAMLLVILYSCYGVALWTYSRN